MRLPDEQLAIAKFPKPDDTRDIGACEILALTLAAKVGIQAAEHPRVTVGKQSVAVITRFDRKADYRVPFLSAASLLGLPQGETGAYKLLADIIRRFGDDVTGDLRESWRSLVGLLLGLQQQRVQLSGRLQFDTSFGRNSRQCLSAIRPY